MQPVYCSNGEWVAVIVDNFMYDTHGEWIAWLDGADIFTRDGMYVGYLTGDSRVMRRRVQENHALRACPPPPPKIRPPAKVPLAPLFAELPWHVIDCFEENPEIFRRISDLRPDWEG